MTKEEFKSKLKKLKHRAALYALTACEIPEDDPSAINFYKMLASRYKDAYQITLFEYDMKFGIEHNCPELEKAKDFLAEDE